MKTRDPLSNLAFKYGTDKCPQLNHAYTPFYYELLKSRRKSIKKVLEIGIGNGKHHRKYFPHAVTGASLYMWRDFFPNAQIYGADNDPETMFKSERIETFLCDETKKEDLLRLIKETGTDIDIFIDDGSHASYDQQFLCKTLLPHFKKEVIYIIENVRLLGKMSRYLAEYDCYIPKLTPKELRNGARDQIMIVKRKPMILPDSKHFRVKKPILNTEDYCGFKLRFRDDFADRYVMRDMLKRDYTRIPKNPKTVIDIGAHIGLFTLAALRAGAEKVYAFEPEEFNYELLCHNIRINGYADRVNCIKLGVGAPGQTKLYIHPANSGASSIYLDADKALEVGKYQRINIISIQDVFKNYSIDYCDILKIDCEGSDRDILNELDEELVNKIGQISVEIHDRSLIAGFVDKLKKWYEAECTNLGAPRGRGGNAWVFRKRKKTLIEPKTNISIFAKPAFLNVNPSRPFEHTSTPPKSGHLMHMSSRIRGEQIAEFIGAKLNPTEGYENDVCIYVKPSYIPGQTFLFEGKKSYLDILDGPHCIDLLKKYPEVTVIAASDLIYEVLTKTLPNEVIIIPEHHCNFERQRRSRKGITVVGCIGTEGSFKFLPADIKERLAQRGIEFVELAKIFTREDVVNFYLNIDVQIIWRPQFQTSYNQLRNPMKVINASSFGIPTIMYEEKSAKEMEGCFIAVHTPDEFLSELDKLKSNPELYDQYAKRCIEKSEKYHIDNIAKLYKNLTSE